LESAGGFSGNGWTPNLDVRAFVSLLCEIVVGEIAIFPEFGTRDASIPPSDPEWVSKPIEMSRSVGLKTLLCDFFRF
jgi:hypothetical protein